MFLPSSLALSKAWHWVAGQNTKTSQNIFSIGPSKASNGDRPFRMVLTSKNSTAKAFKRKNLSAERTRTKKTHRFWDVLGCFGKHLSLCQTRSFCFTPFLEPTKRVPPVLIAQPEVLVHRFSVLSKLGSWDPGVCKPRSVCSFRLISHSFYQTRVFFIFF